MYPFLVAGLLSALSLSPQDVPIRVETVDAMRVCAANHEESDSPCASAPTLAKRVEPVYPEKSRHDRAQGVVRLSIIVGLDGKPRDILVTGPLTPELDQAAVGAVQQWTFNPGEYQGQPVAVRIPIEVSFRLSSDSPIAQPKQGAAAETQNILSAAHEAFSRRDFQTAANLARQVTAQYPKHSSAWNLLGMALLELGELRAAEDALKRQIEIDPSSGYAYNNLGRVYWQEHKYTEAEAQFRKQVVINPNDPYAHANLGMMLRGEKKCQDAIPELDKALTINPNHVGVMLAKGGCDLDLGNQAQGLSELEQAASTASNANTWNSAAYTLAKHKLELDRAEKWAQAAITIEAALLSDTAVGHISPAQLQAASAIAYYWDTLGWIYFQRDEFPRALEYLEPAWFLNASLECGDHLAQTYDKLGRHPDAIRLYSMALASVGLETGGLPDPSLVSDVKDRLAKASNQPHIDSLIDQARADLSKMNTVQIVNKPASAGAAEFQVLVGAPNNIVAAEMIAGEKTLGTLAPALSSALLSMPLPPGTELKIPRRGSLQCEAAESSCRFILVTGREAVRLASREAAVDSVALRKDAPAEPHRYDSPFLGMRFSLADQWNLVHEERGTFTKPANALFGKEGAMVFLVLTREHLEATPELYAKTLESFLAQNVDFQRTSETDVVRDGLTGKRWLVRWSKDRVTYSGVMEFFTVGDDHYRISAMAPVDVYPRYSQNIEEMIRSVQFPLLRLDPKMLDNVKAP